MGCTADSGHAKRDLGDANSACTHAKGCPSPVARCVLSRPDSEVVVVVVVYLGTPSAWVGRYRQPMLQQPMLQVVLWPCRCIARASSSWATVSPTAQPHRLRPGPLCAHAKLVESQLPPPQPHVQYRLCGNFDLQILVQIPDAEPLNHGPRTACARQAARPPSPSIAIHYLPLRTLKRHIRPAWLGASPEPFAHKECAACR
ncbi:hypothetical protein P280DRAFT_79286 [Massarina eburnea CBS 473.64]|uniref:Uncharacterized protein n=1 Tax=Massarina eburnea CBS 473.64 TaxID=1395130 RepID=A0A6A6RW97_9PLEO|nr:hypothetical protein P280DRAFT_79286 [Massarina eburnea CBS 473.64]